MTMRLTTVDEFQLLTCLKHQVWGSKAARFKDWRVGDQLVFLVDKAVAALAEVTGEPYVSKETVWDNGLFPHRIPIRFTHAMLPESRPPVLGDIRDATRPAWSRPDACSPPSQGDLDDPLGKYVRQRVTDQGPEYPDRGDQ